MKYLDLDGLTTFWENAYQKIDDLITTKISEYSNFDSSGTYPNLTAGKATKLDTARKIGITGGAVGTATNFDGSSAINIPITKIDEGILAWSEDYASTGTLLDNIMKISGNNVLAFMPPSAITIEYSTDNGATWLDYGWNDSYKTVLVTPEFGNNALFLGKNSSSLSSNNRLRITFDFIAANMRFTPSKACIYFSGVNNSDSFYTKLSIEKYNNYNKDVWEEFTNQKITAGDWGTFRLTTADWGYKDSTYRARFRCEFYRTADSIHSTAIGNIIIMATKIVHADSYAKNHHLYTFDHQQNATFPNAIKGKKLITDGGKSTQVVKGDGSLEEESALAVASAIDAEHAIEADYAGVADKADKLTTPRTISLSGGAVGTATTFDGSKNVSIPVTALNDLSLTRVYKDNGRANALSLADLALPLFSSNRLAFNNPNSILIYKSNDGGTTWTDYGATDEQKTKFVSGINQPIYIGGKTTGQVAVQDRLRVILTSNRYAYTSVEEFLFYITTAGAESCQCRLSYVKTSQFDTTLDYNSQTYTEITTKQVSGWSGWNRLLQTYSNAFGYDSANNVKAFMFEFWFENRRSGYEDRIGFNISQLLGIGQNVYLNQTGCEMMNNGHLYSYDWQKNVTFPAAVTATKHITQGGSANQVTLGNGSLKDISELSPITDADAEILLDNHIHGIDVSVSGDDVNINVIESTKNGNAWETAEKSLPIPIATQDAAGVISAADKQKIDAINYEDNTLFVGDGTNGMLSIGYDSSKASADMRVFRDRYSTIHVTSYNDTTGGSIAVMESNGGKGAVEVNGDQLAELVLSGAGQVRATLTKENEDGTNTETIIDAAEGITAPKLATIGGTSEQILLGDGTLITFDELKAKLGLI